MNSDAAEDGAVDGEQGQEKCPGCCTEPGHEPVENHLQNLDNGGDQADIGQQAEEGQIKIRLPGPGQRSGLEQVIEDQVVDRNRDAASAPNTAAPRPVALFTFFEMARKVHMPRKKLSGMFSMNKRTEDDIEIMSHQFFSC